MECWYAKPEWYLVILGVPTLIFIGWQAWETKVAAEAARDAARAASLNTEAFINSERPWLVVEYKKIHDPENLGKAFFKIFVTNHGRTVARVISQPEPTEVACVFPDSELPLPYPSSDSRLMTEKIIAPEQQLEVALFYPRSSENRDKRISAGEAQGGNMKAQRIVIHCEIQYLDGVSVEPRKTRFCYQHCIDLSNIGGSLMLCGPKEYNLNT
jgi:hypothetical protein